MSDEDRKSPKCIIVKLFPFYDFQNVAVALLICFSGEYLPKFINIC